MQELLQPRLKPDPDTVLPFVRQLAVFSKSEDFYVGAIILPFAEDKLFGYLTRYFSAAAIDDPYFMGSYLLNDNQIQALQALGPLHARFNTQRYEYYIESLAADSLVSLAQAAVLFHNNRK
jgi:hypothetical protein